MADPVATTDASQTTTPAPEPTKSQASDAKPESKPTPAPAAPTQAPAMDSAQMAQAISQGVAQGLRSHQPATDRQLGRTKFTTDQLIEAKYDDMLDRTAKVAIERELEQRRQEDLAAARTEGAQSAAAVTRVQTQIFQDYPAMMDTTSALYQAVKAIAQDDPSIAATPQSILRAVKAAAYDLGLPPVSKRPTAQQTVQQTVQQIQAAAAAASTPKGSGAAATTPSEVDIDAMSDAEMENYIQQKKFGTVQ